MLFFLMDSAQLTLVYCTVDKGHEGGVTLFENFKKINYTLVKLNLKKIWLMVKQKHQILNWN